MKHKAKRKKANKEKVQPTLKRANECLAEPGYFTNPRKLFDAFWREGELGIMFGATGTGKSILAMELAEALARGESIEGFAMPYYRRRVLYVDLVMSDAQFQLRYSTEGPGLTKTYRFSDGLFRERPDGETSFSVWLREAVNRNGIKAVIVDDLAGLRNSLEGTKETLKLMRELKTLKEETGISILILASAAQPPARRTVTEADLKRMQPLAETADSVFAIGLSPRDANWRYILQTRSRNAAVKWTDQNAPLARIEKREDGFLKMEFDGRFRMKLDERTIDLIRRVKELRDKKISYRKVGLQLNIGKFRKWRPWTHG